MHSRYAPDRFIDDLDYALMRLEDPKDIAAVTVRMLGQYTEVDRCDYAEVEADHDHFVILGDYTTNTTNTITGRYRISDFGSLENHPYVVDDLDAEPPPGTHIPPSVRTEIRSLVCVPLIKAGHVVAGMAVSYRTPHHWSSQEIDVIETAAHRCWDSIEHAAALRRLKASYEDYRAFIAVSSEALW